MNNVPAKDVDTRLVEIRPLLSKHLKAVERISLSSFEYAWDAENFKHFLQPKNNIGVHAVDIMTGTTIGYLVFSKIGKHQYRLLNIAVDEEYRNKGVGAALMRVLYHRCPEARKDKVSLRILADVLESQIEAQKWLAEQGFVCNNIVTDDDEWTVYEFVFQDHPENKATHFVKDFKTKFRIPG